MTGMEHAIEQAARVIVDRYPSFDPISAEGIARALADAGLLLPAPLREEWAVEMPRADAVFTPGDRMDVLTRDLDWPRKHRYVSEWEEQ